MIVFQDMGYLFWMVDCLFNFLLLGFLCWWNFFFVLSCFYPPFWWHFWVCYTDLIYVFTIPLHTWCSMFHNFTSDQQFTGYKILSLLFPMMITFHQRNWNVSNDDDTFSKSTQNSLPWVLPDKYITDWLTIPLILSLLALFSLFLPSTNMSLFKKCNVLFSLMTNNSSMNRFSVLDILLDVKIPVLSISLFSAESGQTSYRKVPCFTSKVLEWYKHMFQIHNFPFCRQSSVHSSANYIHCSVKLSVLISQFTSKTVLSLSILTQRLSFRFFSWGSSLE